MTASDGKPSQIGNLLATPDLSGALDSNQFRRFLDQVHIAVAVSDLKQTEAIVYVNPAFEQLSGQSGPAILGHSWDVLDRRSKPNSPESGSLGAAIVKTSDYVGTFTLERPAAEAAICDAYANVIDDDQGVPSYRLVALVDVGAHHDGRNAEYEQKIREKDIQLFEIQHRVKNNLQLITALTRFEAKKARGPVDTGRFDRLAGRMESIRVLYSLLSQPGREDEIDLGIYLSEVATSVLRAHAVEGIRLSLKVDAYPVSVNVAMPTGLVVNEIMTNSLKHAFVGREGGTVTLHSLSDGSGCRITVADDGVGLPPGVEWPKAGKLSSLIVQSLRENAKAALEVESAPGQGMRVNIIFSRSMAAPIAPA